MDQFGLGDALVPKSLLARLWESAVDPTMITLPLVAAIFCLFRWLHLIDSSRTGCTSHW